MKQSFTLIILHEFLLENRLMSHLGVEAEPPKSWTPKEQGI